jgi:hypothetical protein
MSRFQNKNKVWISNTLKSNSETLGIIKLLKDIGVFREKPKKRKPKKPAKEEEDMEDDEEFLMPPTGGGGGGGGASVGLLPTSNITQALQALKSGVSSQAQQQNLLEKAKEDLQLQYGRMIDLSQIQNRPMLGYEPSEPFVTFPDEEEQYFPPKESVVGETNYEFKEERGGSNIPDDVMEYDVSDKVGEQGIMEDEEGDYSQIDIVAPTPPPRKRGGLIVEDATTFEEKIVSLAPKFKLRPVNFKASNENLQNYLFDLYLKFQKPVPRGAGIRKMKKEQLINAIKDLVEEQYDNIYG